MQRESYPVVIVTGASSGVGLHVDTDSAMGYRCNIMD
jgi:NADP-dependent 3-hydroxy acid dehydrogenase YdfG